ncbi:MAG: type VI secretion protein IcmF/TssM N-terminal domain-containing protein [Polyangiales bacterium]
MRSPWIVAVLVTAAAAVPPAVLPLAQAWWGMVAAVGVASLAWAVYAWRRDRSATALTRPEKAPDAPTTLAELSAVDEEIRLAKPTLDVATALPRVLVLGDGATGASSLIASSGDSFRYATTASDRPLRVWVGSTAVWFDVAGRVARDPSLRTVLLGVLHRLRVLREGLALDGLVLTVSADALTALSESDADALGRRLRAKVDAVRAESGVEAPVYILATGIDRLQGFAAAVAHLRPSERGQVLGVTVPVATKPDARVAKVDEGLREMTTHLLRRVLHASNWRTPAAARELAWQFPQWCEATRPPLLRVVSALCDPSVGAPPVLRGVYLTSAADHGTPLGQAPTQARGWFLSDVVRGVVIPDREFATHSAYERVRRRGSRRLLAATLTCAAALAAVFSVWSWRANEARLDAVSTALDRSIQRPPPAGADEALAARVASLRAGESVAPWYERLGFTVADQVAPPIERALRPRGSD